MTTSSRLALAAAILVALPAAAQADPKFGVRFGYYTEAEDPFIGAELLETKASPSRRNVVAKEHIEPANEVQYGAHPLLPIDNNMLFVASFVADVLHVELRNGKTVKDRVDQIRLLKVCPYGISLKWWC